MSGPNHLWSGDWQQESAAVSEGLAGRRVKPTDPEPPPAEPPTGARRRMRSRRTLTIALAAVLVIAAGAWGLSAVLGSSNPRASTTAAAPPRPPAATGPTQRPVPTIPVPTSPVPTSPVPTTPAPATPAPVTPAPTTTPVPPARPVYWLGMQIETVAPGAAVVDTVRPGSQGDLAGLEPGDLILAIDNRPIRATSDIATAIHGLHGGARVSLQISHGSTLYETEATLAAPPSVYP